MNAIPAATSILEFISNVTIALYALLAMLRLLEPGPDLKVRSAIETSKLLVAQGVIAGLGLKTVATLMKTIEIRTWNQIGITFSILGLRLFLKWHYDRELAEQPIRSHRSA